MRVVQVVRPSAGGIRTHVRTLTSGLIERGHIVRIAAPPDVDVSVPGASRIEAPIAARPHPLLDLRAASVIAAAARDADLLHGHGLRGAWIAALASRRSGKPFIFTAHNLVPASLSALARTSLRYVCRRASAIIGVSNAIAKGLRPYTSNRLDVIPNGIDVAAYEGRGEAHPDVRRIVAIGRLAPEKGFDLLIEAMARLKKMDARVQVVIAGEGPERQKLESMISRLEISDRVSLAGYVEDVPDLLQGADIVVIPSRQEGQGIVALETMAARTPIIATRVGGLPETVGDAGVLVPPEDPVAIAEACEALLRDGARREALADAGRRRVEEYFTFEQMVESIMRVYGQAVGQL